MKFYEELKNIESPSGWFIIIVLFMSWPSFCNVMLNAVFAKISSLDFKTRCRIPLIENKNWTFEQVQYISAPLDKQIWNCTYFNYNYTAIAKMQYEEALMYVENVKNPKINFCTEFIHQGSIVYSVYEEFSLVCGKATLIGVLDISPVYGQVTASITLLPLADLFGRKRIIKWGANLFTAGAVMMSLANTAQILILCRFLVGIGYTLMIYPLEALVVEISNTQLQPVYFIMIHIGNGLGFIIISVIATKIWHWRLLQWAICSILLILPLTTWYIPESPGWFMSKGKKDKAEAILKAVKDPVTQSDLLLSYRNEKINYYQEKKSHILLECKPFFLLKLLYLITLSFVSNIVYFKSFIARFQIPFYESRSNYFILSGIQEIVSYMLCSTLLLIFSRKITIGLLFICSSISYITVAQLKTGKSPGLLRLKDFLNTCYYTRIIIFKGIISLLTTELTTSALYITSLLYINEILPTSHRCTLTGMVYGFGGGLATIVIFHTFSYLIEEDNLFILLSCLSSIGIPLILFADETKNEDLCNTVEETI